MRCPMRRSSFNGAGLADLPGVPEVRLVLDFAGTTLHVQGQMRGYERLQSHLQGHAYVGLCRGHAI